MCCGCCCFWVWGWVWGEACGPAVTRRLLLCCVPGVGCACCGCWAIDFATHTGILKGAVKGGLGFATLCVVMDYLVEEYLGDMMGNDGF